MRVLIVVDKLGSAIDRMAQGIKKYLPHIHIDIIAVHPKRPDFEQLNQFTELAQKADVLDFEYWKTYITLREMYPELVNKKKLLAHHNPYNLFEENWKEFDAVIAYNATMAKELKGSIHFEHTIDIEKFPFNQDYTDQKIVLMVSSRIEGKKGVLPVAQACQRLGYKMVLVGSISDGDYFKQIMDTGVVEFRERVSENELLKAYQGAAVFVCNSIDNFESGTLPNLEAMAVGVPLLTREIGEIPELDNGKNMVVRKGQPEDLDDLINELKNLMEDEDKRKNMREEAWQVAKTKDDVRRAVRYEKLWYSLISDKELVSVIVPTFNRKDTLVNVIGSILKQNYPSVEIVICDDGSTDGTREMVKAIQESGITIKYINTETPDEYNLAKARNLGVIEAAGDILIFLDDRYEMKQDCISSFVSELYPKRWLFGDKGFGKKSFVENFSCVYRREFIDAGMFNCTIRLYGFLTQETRERFIRNKFKQKYIDNAKVDVILKSKAKYHKRDEIRRAKNILWKMGL